jgi:prolyl oligopeptidase
MCPVAVPWSPVEPVTDFLHGVPVVDPYRWLEDQNSAETRAWVEEQTRYARTYLDSIPGRESIRERVRELLDVETYDSFLKCGSRYFFRKRLPGREQPSIYFREGPEGEDQLLVDPAARGSGPYTAVKPLRASSDGSLLLYEVKQGGERMGRFEILDVASRKPLPDSLPHGYLRGFAFAPDGKSFYYVHEPADENRPFYRAAFHHRLQTNIAVDREIFFAGQDRKIRLVLITGKQTLGFLVYRFFDETIVDFYLWGMGSSGRAIPVLRDANYSFAPCLLPGRIFAAIDQNAPNRRIVEVQARKSQNPLYFDLVRETNLPIQSWAVTANYIVTSYDKSTHTQMDVFDHFGNPAGHIPTEEGFAVRIAASSVLDDEFLLERESFAHPIQILRALASGVISNWAQRNTCFFPSECSRSELNFPSIDGTAIPISLVGRSTVLTGGAHPSIMTSYGGYGVSSRPQYSVLVTFLVERGCLFALPNIRGGAEFGKSWHTAAKRRCRQVAFDDFLSAARWLIETGRTTPTKLAIFGGSNSGLLVGAALTQRPHLFRAVLCLVPLLDMLRYHLFDSAYLWKEEFGTADDADDFRALAAYSPYQAVRKGCAYPAIMIVSGDADQNCNAMHARKMVARLQASNSSSHPILLDYSPHRGHSPVLPLSQRIDALSDRLAFLSDQLGLLG